MKAEMDAMEKELYDEEMQYKIEQGSTLAIY